jgi:hypothetical protein
MTIASLMKKAAPSYVRNYFASIQSRLARLEAMEMRVNGLLSLIGELESTLDIMMKNPRYNRADNAGFNGQIGRKAIFKELTEAFEFGLIVETGTWTGDTTGYMAETSQLPVFSGELNYRYHSLARMRLADFRGIILRNMDSRRFLQELSEDDAIIRQNTLFYLDAHWYNDLPLADEIELIAQRWADFVIMVDDFQVPDDEGYGYDDYGLGKALTPEYIEPLLRTYSLEARYPSIPSSEESGAVRGCAVIARRGSFERAGRPITLLRAATEMDGAPR